MDKERKSIVSEALPVLLIGLFLLAVVYLTPHAGSQHGRSFLMEARQSYWGEWGEWAAAWCSLKILLCTGGVFFVTQAFLKLSSPWLPQLLDGLIFPLVGGALLGYFIGMFYFFKAVF